MTAANIDILWILLSTGLVFMMQAGFLCLESGFTRSKNSINVAIKNITDLGISLIVFWAFGYAFMFGLSSRGWIGFTHFLPNLGEDELWLTTFFLFQAIFCGTTVTILSGAVAERMRFRGYLIVSVMIAGLIYPVFGHWAWNGLNAEALTGWLGRRGFIDFAGSTVVHSVGGWVALAALIVIGPRAGRFPKNAPPRKLTNSSLPLATLGVLLLWVGWLGFNGGSALAFNETVPKILVNTIIAGAAGLLTTLFMSWYLHEKAQVDLVLNGTLAGLVAVTASAAWVVTSSAVIIGGVGAIVMVIVTLLLERVKIDDVIGAVPVHLGAGVWGTLAVALFGQADKLNTGLTLGQQLQVQLLGIIVCFIWAFGMTYLLLTIINRLFPLRVTAEEEEMGLNVLEHGASTEIFELFQVMDRQSKTGDLSLRVPIEPYTEVGQIAGRYNKVMAALEDAIAKTDVIVKTAMDGIITFSQHGGLITSLNPAAETIFGYQSLQLQGKSITHLFHQSTSETPALSLGIYQESVGQRKDGDLFPLEFIVTEAKTEQETFYTGIFRDISDRKAAEAAIIHARDEAIKTSRLKSEFLGKVSHELRTPLGAILGFSEMLQMEIFGPLTDDQQDAVAKIIDSTDYQTNIVNAILDQAQLEAGKLILKPAPFSSSSLIDGIYEEMMPLAQAKELDLIKTIPSDFPQTLEGDQKRLRQMMRNLIDNAIKFTGEGQIEVRICCPVPDHWAIEVTDTGPGIPLEIQKDIFNPFSQEDGSATRPQDGTGLGLSITKKLADLMDGQVTVKSTLGKGATFTILLPLILPGEASS
ncbi:MAG: ammonium transporter [Chloroflexota bacterium]